MKALVSSLEQRKTGYRVVEIIDDEKIFPVAETMQWVDFPNEFDPNEVPFDVYWFDPSDNTIKLQNITEG
tara:strand:- start:509 stop:718 length:210 start_codon:yes stop_codon:yes gene_type:complete